MRFSRNLQRPVEYTPSNRAPGEAPPELDIRTFIHFLGAVAALIALEPLFLSLPIAEKLSRILVDSETDWMVVVAASAGLGLLASRWARTGASKGIRQWGLGLFVLVCAVVYAVLLLLCFAGLSAPVGLLPSSAILTACVFAGLTSIVFFTRKNFSYVGPILAMFGFGSLGMVVCSRLFGFNLGIVFSDAVNIIGGGYILQTTFKSLREYRPDAYAATFLSNLRTFFGGAAFMLLADVTLYEAFSSLNDYRMDDYAIVLVFVTFAIMVVLGHPGSSSES